MSMTSRWFHNNLSTTPMCHQRKEQQIKYSYPKTNCPHYKLLLKKKKLKKGQELVVQASQDFRI
jgi:hypothetical protein